MIELILALMVQAQQKAKGFCEKHLIADMPAELEKIDREIEKQESEERFKRFTEKGEK